MTDTEGVEPFGELARLDRVVHEPARLALVTVLSMCDGADFTYLAGAANLSRGNLSAHLSTLETAGIVTVTKQFAGKRPQTWVSLTDRGCQVVRDYWDLMGAWHDRLDTATGSGAPEREPETNPDR